MDAVGDVGDSSKLFTDSPGHPIDTKVEVRRVVQNKERHVSGMVLALKRLDFVLLVSLS